MGDPPAQKVIPQAFIDAAKATFARDRPLVDDLRRGSFFDDPNYLDSLSHDAKSLICAVQHFGDHPDRPGLCHIQSEQALQKYDITLNETHLSTAFALEAMSLRYVPAMHPGRGKSNHHMGCLFQRRWEVKKDLADLNDAVRYYKLAVDVAVESDEVLSEWVCDVAAVFMHRYLRTKQPGDREDAYIYFDWAIELAGESPTRARHISNKGEFLRRTTADTDPNRVDLLTQSIECHEEAVAFCEAHPGLSSKPRIPYGMIHRNAAQSYQARFVATKEATDGERFCSLLEKALTFETEGSNDWERFMVEFAEYYELEARLRGEVEKVVEKACEKWRQVIAKKPNSIASRVNLAVHYQKNAVSYLDQKADSLLSQAVELIEESLRLLNTGYHNPGWVYISACSVYYARYEHSGAVADIDRAIEFAQQATALNREEYDWCRLLSQALIVRYERLRQPGDLQKAGSVALLANQRCPPENFAGKGQCMWMMGKAAMAGYISARNASMLQNSIVAFLVANGLFPRDDSSRPLLLNDLGNAYTQAFTHEANTTHLDKAIEAYKESLSELQRMHKTDQHPNIFMVNAELGYVMLVRFLHWRAESDIEAAVRYYQRSLSSIDESHPRYAIRVGNITYALQLRFEIKRDIKDLKEAQRLLLRAIGGPVPLSDAHKIGLATSLGNTYQSSFKVTEQQADLENAIEHYNQAIAIQGVPLATDRALAMLNKGEVLQLMAKDSDRAFKLEESRQAFDGALQMLSEDNPYYWSVLTHYSDLLYNMFNGRIGPEPDAHGRRALEQCSRVAHLESRSPADRIKAASIAAALVTDLDHDHARARDYILICLKLLPEAILLHENRLEQLRLVRAYQYLPSSAAALSLSAGDPPSTVVHRLELARAFIWDRIEGRPSQLEHLEVEHRELAGRFRILQQRVAQQSRSSSQVGGDFSSVSQGDANRMQRQQDADEYRRVLQAIRELPSFGSFLQTPDAPTDLQGFAQDAPVIFINASAYRSDALIITKDGVSYLPLPLFEMEQVKIHAARFRWALDLLSKGHEQAQAFSEYQDVMKWLWESAAKPVLDSIDWSKYECGPYGKPRVMWVSTGWISVLPIHAAGDYGESTTDEPRSVHDIAVSSYTNSLKALEFTRFNAQRLKSQPSTRQAIIAAMATTPGLGPEGDLDVEPEIDAITTTLAPSFNVKTLRQPDARSVKGGLASATLAHFACHARADRDDPSRSAIMLQDNQTKPSPFSVRVLLKLNLKTCELVYLAACESGASKDLRLRDEGIHIAGGFHIAGVPHVISTLWKVSDTVSAQLAGLFYENLKNNKTEVDLTRAPDALHKAVGELKRQGVHPMLYGPFIHSGP
ncbi:CHAT domain-containing protein [Aspergillus avenaceus]|uniref:CHAT domain-containing protein n=1 Tax=Aspergillus avenaceus TaxID=36643 RepID=A0A5N6TVQ9_ASPAV|nr:CHAT domain-containing protein [Aspergillus avenaceus]